MNGQNSNYGRNAWPGQAPQQDGLAGQFDMWQPNASRPNSNTSAANYPDTGGGASWQSNRDEALTEAFRAINLPSGNPGRSGTGSVASDMAQYTVNPLSQPTVPQHSMSQANQYAGSGMSSNAAQQHHFSQQSRMQQQQQQQPDYSQQSMTAQHQQYLQQQQLSTQPYMTQQQPSMMQHHSQQSGQQQQFPQSSISQQRQSHPQPSMSQHSYTHSTMPQANHYSNPSMLSNTQKLYPQSSMTPANQYSNTDMTSNVSQQQQIRQSPIPQSNQYPNSGISSSTLQQQQYNQNYLANATRLTNQSSQSFGYANTALPTDTNSWSTADSVGNSNNAHQNIESPSWSPNDSVSNTSQTQQTADWFPPHSYNASDLTNAASNLYSNPLDSMTDDDNSPEILVKRMHESAAKEKEKLKGTQRPPCSLSKSSIAILEKDLKEAAAPFQNSETLQQFRKLQLGLISENEKDETSSEAVVSSKLSAEAVEFVPKSKSTNAGSCRDQMIKKLPASRQNDTASSSVTAERQLQASTKTNQEKLLRAQNSEKSPRHDETIKFQSNSHKVESAASVLTSVCWNPLDGPMHCQKMSKSSTLRTKASSSNVGRVVKAGPSDVKNSCDKEKTNDPAPDVEEKKMIATRVPCYDNGSFDESSFLPLLGIFPLTDLGFASEEDMEKVLKRKVTAVEDLPSRLNEVESDPAEQAEALYMADDYINELIFKPAMFDGTVSNFIDALIGYNLSPSAIALVADKIYEVCIVEANFRYLGSHLCDKLSRSKTGLEQFRSSLLQKAQSEFNAMDDLSAISVEKAQRARSFTQFMSELFLNLMLEKNSGVERFAVLGRGTLGVVRKLVDHPNDANLQCAIKVLKLTITALEDSLQHDNKGSIENLNKILDDLEAIYRKEKYADSSFDELTMKLLSGFVQLRQQNWGRESRTSSESSVKPDPRPEQDENYYMNEPVFFTPNGKQYTAADAADPDFYSQHLAAFSVGFPAAEQYVGEPNMYPKSTGASYPQNPLTDADSSANDIYYPTWSGGEAHQQNRTSEDDDYDADLEAFLRSSGQM